MAPLRLPRLLQALPWYRASAEQISRTKLPALTICTSPRTMAASAGQVAPSHARDDIIFSAGQPSHLPGRASNLLSKWDLSASKKAITRHYTFTSFSKAWEFMSAVAEECKLRQHHPAWSNLYSKVTIEWTTHKPEGLSIKDVEMAEFCDRCADEIGLKV